MKEADYKFLALTDLAGFLSEGKFSAVFLLLDENTYKHCYPKLIPLLPQHNIIQIQSGEENKTIPTCNAIWQKLTNAHADRNSLLINLGGGVIGDMGGFAASCYKRGIRFINIPTTLLAMVDASVGGKTGVDFGGYKNQLGLFAEPAALVIDTTFLETLPGREIRSGFAEVIKHYLIADGTAFNQLMETVNWPEVVEQNIRIKLMFVTTDPHEKGIRKALNFGHTIGHAVESYFLQAGQPVLHGEAIAVGIVTESYISFKKDMLTQAELDAIIALVERYFQRLAIPDEAFDQLLMLIKQDKKNTAGLNQFTLLQGIGKYTINNFVEEDLIMQSLKFYNSLPA